jgi:hypothetical protein
MELFRLFGSILIDDKDAIESLKNVDNQGKETNKGLGGIISKGAMVGAAVVAGTGAAIGGLMAMASTTSDNAAKWLELSQRTDIGIESLQRWGYAAGQSGADIEKLEVGMKKLSQSVVDAQGGSEKAKSAYEALGISMSDLSTMSPEQVFDTVMNKLADMPDSMEKNVIGNQLLGKSFTELKPLLSEGSDGMAALKDQADQLGLVMSEDSVVAAEGFGDQMDNVKLTFEAMKNKVMAELMPALSNILGWFIDQAPQIQEVAHTVFDGVSTAISFITDHANILIPVLAGVVGAFAAFQIINTVNGLMAALKASTIAQTLAQGGLNAVMAANPITIVVLVITALIAIVVALVMNWDTVKEKAGELWDKIQEVFGAIGDKISEVMTAIGDKVSEIFGGIKDFITEKITAIKDAVSNTFGAVKDSVTEKWDAIKDKTSEIWNGVKDTMGSVMEAAKSTVQEKLSSMKQAYEENGGGIKGIAAAAMEGIKGYFTAGFDFIDKLTGGKLSVIVDKFKGGFDKAKEVVSGAIEKIKGFLNFNWEFPKLKLPHFKVAGSMNPLDWFDQGMPKISVDWYAQGGIFSKPTIFNTPYGLKGVGDAPSPEVVAPLSDLSEIIRGVITDAIAPLYLNSSSQPDITIEVPVTLDGRVLFDSVRKSSQDFYRRSRTSPFPY